MGLMLFPGDLTAGYLKRDAESVAECNRIQLRRWLRIVNPIVEAGIALRVTVGNHDVGAIPTADSGRCGRHNWPYVPDQKNLDVFYDEMKPFVQGDMGPTSDGKLTYSFDEQGCHFAVLNAYTMFHHNAFSNETLKWLDADLKKAADKGLKSFVVSHPPAFPGGGHLWDSIPFYDPSYSCDGYSGIDRRNERDRFWNILKKNRVVAYLCGHEHNIQVQEVEGIWHVVSGALTPSIYPLNGTPADTKERNRILYDGEWQNPRASILWPWEEDKKSYWGWCMLTVQGDKVTMDVYGTDQDPSKGAKIRHLKSFTLRPESRLQ
jgi:hypothetical protein